MFAMLPIRCQKFSGKIVVVLAAVSCIVSDFLVAHLTRAASSHIATPSPARSETIDGLGATADVALVLLLTKQTRKLQQ